MMNTNKVVSISLQRLISKFQQDGINELNDDGKRFIKLYPLYLKRYVNMKLIYNAWLN